VLNSLPGRYLLFLFDSGSVSTYSLQGFTKISIADKVGGCLKIVLFEGWPTAELSFIFVSRNKTELSEKLGADYACRYEEVLSMSDKFLRTLKFSIVMHSFFERYKNS
jgi:hypothetical protein